MATVYYYGDAVPVKDVWSITPANVDPGDTFTVTINGKDITVTAVDSLVASVTALLAAALNSNVAAIPEFTEMVATDMETYVDVTGRDGGNPIGISASSVGGALTALNTTAATGPAFIDNADNYSGNTAPVNGDELIHVRGDILYALDQTSLTLAAYRKVLGSGRVGLPEYNQRGYDEYRPTYLHLSECPILEVDDDSDRVKINPGTGAACVANIRSNGRREDTSVPCVLLLGTHASNQLNLFKGDVGVAFYDGEAAQWPTVTVAYLEDRSGDVIARFGDGLSTITSFKQQGGQVWTQMACTTYEQYDGIVIREAGAWATANINSGQFIDRSPANITTMLRVSKGGVADLSRDLRSITIAACELYSGATLLDPNNRVTFTAGIDLVRCRLSDITLDVGTNRNLAITAA